MYLSKHVYFAIFLGLHQSQKTPASICSSGKLIWKSQLQTLQPTLSPPLTVTRHYVSFILLVSWSIWICGSSYLYPAVCKGLSHVMFKTILKGRKLKFKIIHYTVQWRFEHQSLLILASNPFSHSHLILPCPDGDGEDRAPKESQTSEPTCMRWQLPFTWSWTPAIWKRREAKQF